MRYGKITPNGCNELILYRPIDGYLTPEMLKEQGYKPLNTTEMHNPKFATCIETDTGITVTWEKYYKMVADSKAKTEIASLKKELSETDYKISKCSEFFILGLELPYNVEALHSERQNLRDKINTLENEIGV